MLNKFKAEDLCVGEYPVLRRRLGDRDITLNKRDRVAQRWHTQTKHG